MTTNYTDPVTGIVIPTPNQEPGPLYATDISNALLSLAHLKHTGVSNQDGYQIPSAGIDFNADLSAQSHNLTSLRSTRYTSQSSTLVGVGDLNCLYFKNGDLWLNNGSGTPVQITAAGIVINTNTNNTYPSLHISSNKTISSSDGYINCYISSTSGTVQVTLPAVADVAPGRFYVFKDFDGTAATHNITIAAAGSDKLDNTLSSIVFKTNYQAIMVISGTTGWNVYYFNRYEYNSGERVAFNASSNLDIYGIQTIESGGIIFAGSGSNIALATGSALTCNGALTVQTTGTITFNNDIMPILNARSLSKQFRSTPGQVITNWTTTLVDAITSTATYADLWVEIPTHNGATLSTVEMTYNIATSHFPYQKLQMRIYRISKESSSVDYLRSTGSGIVSVYGYDAATYYNGGSLATLTYTCNSNNVIDNGSYVYYVYVQEEAGAGALAGNHITGFKANFTNITSMQFA